MKIEIHLVYRSASFLDFVEHPFNTTSIWWGQVVVHSFHICWNSICRLGNYLEFNFLHLIQTLLVKCLHWFKWAQCKVCTIFWFFGVTKAGKGTYPKITDCTVSAPDNLLRKISKDKELLSRPPVNIMNAWPLIYFLVGHIICTLSIQLVEFYPPYFFLSACRPKTIQLGDFYFYGPFLRIFLLCFFHTSPLGICWKT